MLVLVLVVVVVVVRDLEQGTRSEECSTGGTALVVPFAHDYHYQYEYEHEHE